MTMKLEQLKKYTTGTSHKHIAGAGFTPPLFPQNKRKGLTRGLSFNNTKKGAGFTLIELLVGMAMFVLIAGAVIGIFISGIRLQQQYLATQETLNQLSFAIEYMSRALRMAIKEKSDPEVCLVEQGTGYNYEIPIIYQAGGESLGKGIRFINHLQVDECQEFFLDGTTLKYKKGAGMPIALTSPRIEIERLRFQLVGQSGSDTNQPKVTISLKVISPVLIELQTTISQRNLDKEI